jgi:2-polyprenyl-3-methyl-5-hydroxy-6-metoxy-1,4-benzoquinol methylase
MTAIESSADQQAADRDALVGRLFQSAIGAMEVFCIDLGRRLGYYAALDAAGAATSTELAAATGTQERYAREWLEQQAASGILTCENPDATAVARRFALPAAYREVFLEPESLNYFAGVLRLVVGATSPFAAVEEVYRRGGGVPYMDYGVDTLQGIAAMNRPMFLNQLGSEWLPALPDVDARLQSGALAWVADVGCGTGWSSIAIAKAYPGVRVDGFDLDEASVEVARAHAAAAGVADCVSFAVRDAADPVFAGRYDLVTAFETLHDIARPVDALRSMRGLLAPGGVVLVADENVGEGFSAPGDDIERLNYAFSVLHCLPATMAEEGPVEQATGTVMRPETLRDYATQAGFAGVEVLPIAHDFWRFYRLNP